MGNYLCTDAANNIVAVPLTLYPGTATAYYYNKAIFAKLGLSVPTEWADFVAICKKINSAGYVAVAPWKDNKKITTGLWDIQFSLGPTFSYALKDQWDLDKSGTMSQNECSGPPTKACSTCPRQRRHGDVRSGQGEIYRHSPGRGRRYRL